MLTVIIVVVIELLMTHPSTNNFGARPVGDVPAFIDLALIRIPLWPKAFMRAMVFAQLTTNFPALILRRKG